MRSAPCAWPSPALACGAAGAPAARALACRCGPTRAVAALAGAPVAVGTRAPLCPRRLDATPTPAPTLRGAQPAGRLLLHRLAARRAAAGGLRATSGAAARPALGRRCGAGSLGLPSGGRQRWSSQRRRLGCRRGRRPNAALPYVGIGYTGLSARGGWGFSADLGVVALTPGSTVRFGARHRRARTSTTRCATCACRRCCSSASRTRSERGARACRRRAARPRRLPYNLACSDPAALSSDHERRPATHRRPRQEQPRRALHEGHRAVPDVRLLRPRRADPQGLRRRRPDDRQRARGRGRAPGHQGLRQLADDPAAVRQRRVRRRLGHHDGDVPGRRAAAGAGRRRPEPVRRCSALVVGITGATGAVYGVRLLRARARTRRARRISSSRRPACSTRTTNWASTASALEALADAVARARPTSAPASPAARFATDGDGHRAVLDEDAGRDRARPVATTC